MSPFPAAAGRALRTLTWTATSQELFQSSPAPKDGRYEISEEVKAWAIKVSILARPEGRALHKPPPNEPRPNKVSILARPEGRALRQGRSVEPRGRKVSILARPEGRALLTANFRRRAIKKRFNPRPPRRTGATDGATVYGVEICVSILARPEGRALPFFSSCEPQEAIVSILARPEGRALPTNCPRSAYLYPFQSSPAPKDGRYIQNILETRSSLEFQSSPAPKDGRYEMGWEIKWSHRSFNPRPPRRTGATLPHSCSHVWISVSILARPEGRALLSPLPRCRGKF